MSSLGPFEWVANVYAHLNGMPTWINSYCNQVALSFKFRNTADNVLVAS